MRGFRRWQRQSGGVLLLGVGAILLALSTLAVVDVGQVFYIKRELQKTADLAALAGAQFPGDCNGMQQRATQNAARNDSATPNLALTLTCGTWAADRPADERFQAGTAAPDALRVVAAQEVPYFILNFMGGERSKLVEARSTAANPVTGGLLSIHSIGTGVARADLNAGLLNPLLSGLLRSNVNLSLVSYQGLADAKVRLLDIVRADPINLGSVDSLLGARVSLYDFVVATANASPDSLVKTTLLNNLLNVNLRDLNLDLGQVLRLQTLDPNSVAQASLSALDLVMLAAQVANGSHAVALQTGLPLVGLSVKVIEPPQYAIGGLGATARSAQVRLQLVLKLSSDPSIGALLNTLSSLIAFQDIHINLELAAGQAVLTEAVCAPRREDALVGMRVSTGLIQTCISNDANAGFNNCPAKLTVLDVPLIKRKLELGAPALTLQQMAQHDIVFGPGSAQGLLIEDERPYTVGSSVGNTLTSALNTLFNTVQGASLTKYGDPTKSQLLGNNLISNLLSGLLNLLLATVDTLVNEILQAILPVINSVLNTLVQPVIANLVGGLIDPLLSQLGLSLGYSDVRHIKLFCNEAVLVD